MTRYINLDEYDGNYEAGEEFVSPREFPKLWDEDENYIRPCRSIPVDEYLKSKNQ